jgi:hypothetical protein
MRTASMMTSDEIASETIKELRAENAALRAVLKFYADPQSYGLNGGTVNRILFDVGKKARAALGKETATNA